MRRLLLQVLLEDEKILIGVHSHRKMTSRDTAGSMAASRHPRCGAGHKYRAVLVSLSSSCADVITKVSGTVNNFHACC